MSTSVTFRLDPETNRILRDLAPRGRGARSRVIREALKARWETVNNNAGPSSREVYASLGIRPGKPRAQARARNIKQLLKEKLRAKRRAGTL